MKNKATTSASIKWSAPRESGFDGFTVTVSTSGKGDIIAPLASAVLEYVVTSLKPATEYQFRVASTYKDTQSDEVFIYVKTGMKLNNTTCNTMALICILVFVFATLIRNS